MNNSLDEHEFPEPERYELHESPYYHFELNRREFVTLLGAGVLISVGGRTVWAQRGGRSGRGRGGVSTLVERLHIGEDGGVTVLTGKVEVGQGSRTQITQAAAEELRLPATKVRLIMADSAVVPNDGGTAGSRTTPSTIPAVRKACAAARQLLLKVAAEVEQADAADLSVRDGGVWDRAGRRRMGYADLASEKHREALQRGWDPNISLTPVQDWKIMGRELPKVGSRAIVTGKHQYPSDILRPGMLYGKVLRPETYGAELKDIQLDEVRTLDGVTVVRDGNFVGFAAATTWEAEQARDLVVKGATWETKPYPSSEELFDHLRRHADAERPRRQARGNKGEAFAQAAQQMRATYHVAYIQHAPMEPRAALAEWDADALTVWTGTQQPARVRSELARAFRMPEEKVRVVVPDTGGGFGGKHTGEAALEAARLARGAGRPVRVQWSREEEFQWAYFRPAGVMDVAASLNEDGQISGWEHINILSGSSALDTPYNIPNVEVMFQSSDGPLRSGSYRALASTANAFARESFMDELAHKVDADPLEFRLLHLTHERLRAVLVTAADRFGWRQKWKSLQADQTHGVGLACGTEKASFVATCASVQADPDAGTYHVDHVCVAFECGAVMDPANLRSQIEGCVLQGLGAVMEEEMRFKDGKILNPKFSEYRVPRLRDVPTMDVVLVNRPDLASVGAGETPIIGIAPAVANGLFNAVGERIRALPLRSEKWKYQS